MGAELAFLFQPDTLLTNCYLETIRRKSHVEPEKTLMLAVLEDVLYCFQRNIYARTAKEKTLYQEAEHWILDESSHWLFSFEMICASLDIYPEYLRRGLMNWKRVRLKDHPEVLSMGSISN